MVNRRFYVGLTVVGLFIGGLVFLFFQIGQRYAQEKDQSDLVVLAYSSFIDKWGPGPQLAQLFQKQTNLKIRFVEAADSTLMLERLKLRNPEDRIDLVIGLDESSHREAQQITGWRSIPTDSVRFAKGVAEKGNLVPYDFGVLTFVYKKGSIQPPTSLDDLLNPRFKKTLALEDPRTSTPGLSFILWVLTVKGEKEGFEFLKKLQPSIYNIAQSWSTAYGLFKENQAKLVFSYSTSPEYHRLEEKSSLYDSVSFKEGHVTQTEYMGVPQDCFNCHAALKFAEFILTEDAQRIISRKNFMLSAVEGVSEKVFSEEINQRKTRLIETNPVLIDRKEELLQQWKNLQL